MVTREINVHKNANDVDISVNMTILGNILLIAGHLFTFGVTTKLSIILLEDFGFYFKGMHKSILLFI